MGRLLVLAQVGVAVACAGPPPRERAGPPPLPAPQVAPAAPPSVDDPYPAHLTALRARLAAAGQGDLTLIVEPPFVIATDLPPAAQARRAHTVRWASDALERDFFARRPTRILDVFLWRDAASYQRGVRALTGHPPSTPFGFYSSDDDGLFMDISTGGGTLVHELVHPYVEADFPAAPPWLNEGLGSLFEQSGERDGHIVGFTNWRLARLQDAIERRSMPRLRALLALDPGGFYRDPDGLNYAAARYLLYHLQQRGLLIEFYRRFRAAHADDPTGYATLCAVLGEPDLIDFQRRWEADVLELRFTP